MRTQTELRVGAARFPIITVIMLIVIAVGVGVWMFANRTKTVEEVEEMLKETKRMPSTEARGIFASAERHLREHVDASPNDARLLVLLARVLAGQRKHEETAEILERVPVRSPQRAEALFRAGQSWLEAKYRRKAERVWREASQLPIQDMSLTPIQQEARRANVQASRRDLCKILAMEMRRADLWEVTQDMYEAASPRMKFEPLLMRLRYEFEMIEPPLCLSVMEPALRLEPDEYHTLRAAGLYMLGVQRSDESRELLYECTKRAPEDPIVWESWLECLNRTADLFRLALDVKSLPKSAKSSAECWKFIEIVAAQEEDMVEAERAARMAVELAPSVPEYRHRLGQVLARVDKKQESEQVIAEWKSIDAARKSLRTNFDSAKSMFYSGDDDAKAEQAYNIGAAYEALLERDEARGWYSVALVYNPAHPLSITALQRLRAQSGSTP